MQIVQFKWRDLFFVIIGCILATICNNWSFFTFSKDISIADLVTAVIGAFIGLYIASKLTSDISSDRIEKDLLINELSPIKPLINRLYSSIEIENLAFTDAVKDFKSSSQILDSMTTSVKMCKSTDMIDHAILLSLSKIRKLHRDITKLPITSTQIFIIPNSEKLKILSELKETNETITSIIFQINKR